MKVWLKRFGYAMAFVAWLFLMCVPALLCGAMMNSGELRWGDDPQNHIRLFLLQESGQEGIGIQWTRPDRNNNTCVRTTVRYLMLTGKAQNSRVCQCATEAGDVPDTCQKTDS